MCVRRGAVPGAGGRCALSDLFPRLAGQHAPYVAERLRKLPCWPNTTDHHAMMRSLASHLSDRDIDAVSQYVALLR